MGEEMQLNWRGLGWTEAAAAAAAAAAATALHLLVTLLGLSYLLLVPLSSIRACLSIIGLILIANKWGSALQIACRGYVGNVTHLVFDEGLYVRFGVGDSPAAGG